MQRLKPCILRGDGTSYDLTPDDEWTLLPVARDVAVKGYLANLMRGGLHFPDMQLCIMDGEEIVDTFDTETAEWRNA